MSDSNEHYKLISTPIISKEDGEQICIFNTTQKVKEIYDDDKFSKIVNVKGRFFEKDKVRNCILDDARYFDYDKKTNTVLIRIVDKNEPYFRIEIPINIDHIQKWIRYNDDIDL